MLEASNSHEKRTLQDITDSLMQCQKRLFELCNATHQPGGHREFDRGIENALQR